MTFSAVFLAMMAGLSAPILNQVYVQEVEGPVLYGAGTAEPSVPVKVGQKLGPGTFSAGNGGTLYLSAFPGSYLRLAEDGTLFYQGDGRIPEASSPSAAEHGFQLRQGKLRVNAKEQDGVPQHYFIEVPRARLDFNSGSCVICMHGEGTYVYVARGRIRVIPAQKPGAAGAEQLKANGTIAVLDSNGDFQIRPMTAAASATQNCLLGGLAPDVSGGGLGTNKPVDVSGPVVSPTQ